MDCPTTDLSDIGLTFIVKDWDFVGTNEQLGKVEVAYPTLIQGNGDAMEFQVTPPEGVNTEAGYLLLRFRKATSADVASLKDTKHPKNLFKTSTKEAASAAWAVVQQPTSAPSEEPKVEARAAPALVAEEPIVDEKVPNMTSQLHLKVEIVACRNLLVADKGGTSDPYVKAALGSKDLHKTKHILKT